MTRNYNYEYSIELATDHNIDSYVKLYADHYDVGDLDQAVTAEMICKQMKQDYENEVLLYFITATHHRSQVASATGVNGVDPENTIFQLMHLVTHTEHRRQGLASGMHYFGVKILIALGAKKIRTVLTTNQINEAIDRHYMDIGYIKTPYVSDSIPEYLWQYELDVDTLDLNSTMRS